MFDNKIWILGGTSDRASIFNTNGDTVYYNDVWYSANGIDWTRAIADAPWGHALTIAPLCLMIRCG